MSSPNKTKLSSVYCTNFRGLCLIVCSELFVRWTLHFCSRPVRSPFFFWSVVHLGYPVFLPLAWSRKPCDKPLWTVLSQTRFCSPPPPPPNQPPPPTSYPPPLFPFAPNHRSFELLCPILFDFPLYFLPLTGLCRFFRPPF